MITLKVFDSLIFKKLMSYYNMSKMFNNYQ